VTPRRRRAISVVVLFWAVVSVAGDIGLLFAPMPPGTASDQATSQSLIIRILAIIGWPVMAGVLATLMVVLFVNRVAPHEGETSAVALRGNARIQTAWVGINIFVVLTLAVYGTIALASDQPGAGISTTSAPLPQPQSTTQPLEVQVIAQQWYFTYRFPSYGGIETDHLVLPVNQRIQFHITSLDVVHSFWFYALGVKADAVPLNDQVFTVTPEVTGTFRIQCSELCGLWHGNMYDNNAQVVSASQFQAWIAQEQQFDAPIMKYLVPYSHVYEPQPNAYGS
jgi:cytochrome c oxidase subunit 2